MAIKRALASVTGVSAVEVDVLTKMVTLTIADEQALDRARASLDDIGYPATLA
jgi:copper chaperone CopZ